jgi:hypothetical protein
MRAIRLATVAATAMVFAASAANAQGYGSPQQYYSSWKKHPTANTAYRTYYYKPTPDYAGYKHHYVIQKGQHGYFYNPYEKQYWGRCPLQSKGKPQYSLLPPEWRKPVIDQIPESAFPPMGDLPPIPESKGGVQMDLPPDDLPTDILAAQ